MSDDCLLLHGCGVTFGQTVPYGDDGFLRVIAGAFDHFFATPDHGVDLLWGGHKSDQVAATTNDRSLSLFADGSGVWFRAVVTDRIGPRQRAITRTSSPMNQASVNFVVIDEREDTFLGRRRCSIVKARMDHIAIVEHGAFRKHSAVWAPRAGLDMAPAHIRDFEQRFQNICASSATQEFAYARLGAKR